MSDPYLYYNSIKDTPVSGHLDFNCLKLKYEVNHDILLFIFAPGYTVSHWDVLFLGLAWLIKISDNQSIYKRKTIIDMKIQKSVTFNGCSVYFFN